MPDRRQLIDWAIRPSAAALLVMAAVLLAADQALLHTGEGPWSAGPLDETAHLLTGALVLAALPGLPDRSFALGLLSMSVMIDLDHVPGRLGYEFLTRGTDRPYTHSLLTIALIALVALAWRRRRSLLLGAMVGIAAHFARDLSESRSGVPLLWPWSRHSYTLPHWTYVAAMAVVLAAALWRALAASRHAVADIQYPRLVWSDEFNGPAGTAPDAHEWSITSGPTAGPAMSSGPIRGAPPTRR